MTTYGTGMGEWVNALELRAPYYLVILDIEGQMSFCNSHFYNSFRAAHTGNTEDGFFSLVHESDRQQLSRTLSTCAFRDQAIHSELRIKDDSFRWVDWEISRIQKPENMSEKFLCLGSDIAGGEQHKKNRESFEQHYQPDNGLFLSFMEHTPWFTWIVDEEENLMFANKTLLTHFHFDESVLGKRLSSIIPVSIAGILAEKHNKVLQGETPEYSVAKWPLGDGQEQEYRIITFPIRAGGSARMVGGLAAPL